MYVAGIDMGSAAAKVMIMGDSAEVLSYVVAEAEPDAETLGRRLMTEALKQAHLSWKGISYIMSTGYGRVTIPFATESRTEIMCHALGIHHLFPSVRTVIDIGGQDSKGIRIDDRGRVRNFAMNDRCAAGTGRFTEVMARALDVPLDRWGELVASAPRRARISSTCTVFAESEVISKIAEKVPLNEILAGVCESIVARVFQMVQKMGAVEKDVAFTGGVANNKGVARILEEKLGVDLFIPEIPQSTGALGACYLARSLVAEASRVLGTDR